MYSLCNYKEINIVTWLTEELNHLRKEKNWLGFYTSELVKGFTILKFKNGSEDVSVY
jgi:hypothetical protein